MTKTEKEVYFIGLLTENQTRITKLCAIYTLDAESQKDLEQEVIMNIWKSLDGFRKEAKISTWIYRIILNVCLKHRYSLKKNVVSIEGLHEELADEGEVEEGIHQDLQSCIQALAFNDKSIIVLYLEELPYRSIGEILGISENHVAVKIKRIREKLSNCLHKIQSK